MADAAHPACILDTRKTVPGLRLVDKWAVSITSIPYIVCLCVDGWYIFWCLCVYVFLYFQVSIGGGKNHRMGLFDMVMIKDNHISIAGGISNAMRSVDQYLEEKGLQMEVEVFSSTLWVFIKIISQDVYKKITFSLSPLAVSIMVFMNSGSPVFIFFCRLKQGHLKKWRW